MLVTVTHRKTFIICDLCCAPPHLSRVLSSPFSTPFVVGLTARLSQSGHHLFKGPSHEPHIFISSSSLSVRACTFVCVFTNIDVCDICSETRCVPIPFICERFMYVCCKSVYVSLHFPQYFLFCIVHLSVCIALAWQHKIELNINHLKRFHFYLIPIVFPPLPTACHGFLSCLFTICCQIFFPLIWNQMTSNRSALSLWLPK